MMNIQLEKLRKNTRINPKKAERRECSLVSTSVPLITRGASLGPQHRLAQGSVLEDCIKCQLNACCGYDSFSFSLFHFLCQYFSGWVPNVKTASGHLGPPKSIWAEALEPAFPNKLLGNPMCIDLEPQGEGEQGSLRKKCEVRCVCQGDLLFP